jgi:hypothetical protein
MIAQQLNTVQMVTRKQIVLRAIIAQQGMTTKLLVNQGHIRILQLKQLVQTVPLVITVMIR